MCSATLLFIICAGAVTDVFSREITRPKRTFDFERWFWGFFEDNYPMIYEDLNPQTNFSFTLSFNYGATPKLTFTATTSDSDYKLDMLNLPSKEKRRKNTSKISTTKATDAPLISRVETKPIELPTTPISERKPAITSPDTKVIDPTNIFTTTTDNPNSFTTDSLSTSTTENKPSDTPASPTIESFLTNSSSAPIAEIRLLNSSVISSPEDNNEVEAKTTTEVIATETTSVSLETTTADYCDPLPGKLDFSAPGRRLNEEKCMGYVWELRNRIKKYEQDLLCKRRLFINHAIGGRKADVGEFPHMGAIGWKAAVGTWVFKCGSSLISSNFVLTAAHCTRASPRDSSIADPVPKIVRLGDKRIIDEENFFTVPTDANISRIIMHPQYSSPMQYYDIALMELEEPVEFTRLIQPACLWNSFSTGEPGHEATLTGWGVIESGSLKNSPELQAATVDVLENEQCDGLLQNSHNRNWKGFREHQLCAGKLAGGVDSCQGDSGGPLQMKMNLSDYETERQGQMHYIIGIISFGVGCAHKNLPGVYTRISSFIDWIEDNVWRNGNERLFLPPPESNVLGFSPGVPSFLRG